MIEFSTIDNNSILSSVQSVLSGKRLVLSNYYGVNNEDACEIYLGNDSVAIRKREFDFYRIFLLTADLEEANWLLQNLGDDRYIINIPSKKPITGWNRLLNESGFEPIGIYNRYYNTNLKIRKSACGDFATMKDLESVDRILKTNFSLYTDHLPTQKQLTTMIDNNQVLVSKDEAGEVKGTLIYTLHGKKCYFNIWIDFSGKGLFLLYKAYNIAVEQGIQYVYFWVNSTNTDVIRLHQMMGTQPDGLVDYSFMKRMS